MIKKVIICFLSVLFLLLGKVSYSQDAVILDTNKIERNFGNKLSLYTDSQGLKTISDVTSEVNFVRLHNDVPNLGTSNNAYWLKFNVLNTSKSKDYILQLPLPTIDYLDFYLLDDQNQLVAHEKVGDRLPYSRRNFDNPIYTFRFDLSTGKKYAIYLRLKGGEQLQAPLILGKGSDLINEISNSFMIFGIYIGIVSVMFIYNLFLYISTKDKSYLYYIVYIFVIA